jgi:hypothetical protein
VCPTLRAAAQRDGPHFDRADGAFISTSIFFVQSPPNMLPGRRRAPESLSEKFTTIATTPVPPPSRPVVFAPHQKFIRHLFVQG